MSMFLCVCVCLLVEIVESFYTADFESYVIVCRVLYLLKKSKSLGLGAWQILFRLNFSSNNSTAKFLCLSNEPEDTQTGFGCLSWLLSFKVAQKRKEEGQVNLMKRGGKRKQEWPKFSNVKVRGTGNSGSLVVVVFVDVEKAQASWTRS